MVTAENAGAILTIELDAIAANYALLRAKLGTTATCAAVVKSDAYGLGLKPVSRKLAQAGCRQFFVAQLDEAITLRTALADIADDASVFVLNGIEKGLEDSFEHHRAVPVLNSLAEIEIWSSYARQRESEQPAIIHIDTGMERLGLSTRDVDVLAGAPDSLGGLKLLYHMSHLACADERDHPLNGEQRDRFDAARANLPAAPASLANSSGIFLGSDYHYQMARPGAALYGLNPISNESNPMKQVINLKGKILQLRRVDRGRTVGYGATHRVTRDSRIATVAVGYGDGYLRALGNRGSGYLKKAFVPVVGRVSMDLITFDVTDVPEHEAQPGRMIELIGEMHPADNVASEAGTIGYEILTGLGRRYFRDYRGEV